MAGGTLPHWKLAGGPSKLAFSIWKFSAGPFQISNKLSDLHFKLSFTHSLQAPSDGGEAWWDHGAGGGTEQGRPYSHAVTLVQPEK